jgi:transmembrane protein DUF3556
MSFAKPTFSDVDPEKFLRKPLTERMRILALNWVENGFRIAADGAHHVHRQAGVVLHPGLMPT